MGKYLDDILFLVGGALIVVGFYLVLPVLALFASGTLLIVLSILIGMGERKEK